MAHPQQLPQDQPPRGASPPPLRCCLVFGGPSAERDISAGSIKPWITTLAGHPEVRLAVIFLDRAGRAVPLPERYHYTNTCADFEIALGDDERLSERTFDALLAGSDLVLPILHGRPGEDGAFARRLQALDVPYLFSRPEALARSFDKAASYATLAERGLPVPAHRVVSATDWGRDRQAVTAQLLAELAGSADGTAAVSATRRTDPASGAPLADAVAGAGAGAPTGTARPTLAVKPRGSGSSLGVSLVPAEEGALAEALDAALLHDDHALVEELLSGTEFSVLVLDDERGRPVALAPTEIDKHSLLYDTRSKYLHGEGATLHTPLRVARWRQPVRQAAAAAYTALGLRQMARVDGFVDDGRVLVTDVNGISGMGFSSFVFLQTAMIGVSHARIIAWLIERACGRRLPLDEPSGTTEAIATKGGRTHGAADRQPTQGPAAVADLATTASSAPARAPRLALLFGGATSERQVSRQSGVFAGLCLAARGFDVRYLFMDRSHRFTEVGLFYALHHDVEEIEQLIADGQRRAALAAEAQRLAAELPGLCDDPLRHLVVGPTTTLPEAVAGADVVFSALHGGVGEDGSVQAALELCGVPANGSDARVSRLCADKWALAQRVAALDIEGLSTPHQRLLEAAELARLVRENHDGDAWRRTFAALTRSVGARALVIKPRSDGCSTGVKLLRDGDELALFARSVVSLCDAIPAGTFGPGSREIKLPLPPPREWIVEQALVDEGASPDDTPTTDLAAWFASRRYVELTCGILQQGDGTLVATTPSVALAADAELSLEEKFQQGTGTNLLLSAFLPEERLAALRRRLAALATALGLSGYARIDGFYDRRRDELLVIEVNTLCALTEATVFYTQVLDTFGWSPPDTLAHIARLALAQQPGQQRWRGSTSDGSALAGQQTGCPAAQ